MSPYITGKTEIAGREYICQIIQDTLFVDGVKIEKFLERLDDYQYRKFFEKGIVVNAENDIFPGIR